MRVLIPGDSHANCFSFKFPDFKISEKPTFVPIMEVNKAVFRLKSEKKQTYVLPETINSPFNNF